jgi:sec-independent protein translocase protein TatA
MFGSIGTPEIIMIFVIALIVFGPRKLPQLGKTLGKGLSEFRKASQDMKSSIEKEIEMEDLKKELDGVKELTDLTSDNPNDRK